MLGLIKRTVGFNAPYRVKLHLYTTLVKPLFSYASIAYSCSKADLNQIERIQSKATKNIINDYVSDYPTRLHNTKLLPSSFIKDINYLCFLCECIHNFIDIRHILSFYNADTSRTRLGQQVLPLRSVRFNSELAGLFLSNRVYMWNILPNTIKQINCRNRFVKPFNKLLYNFYIVKLTTTYHIDNSCTWVTVCRCPQCRQARNTFLSLSF